MPGGSGSFYNLALLQRFGDGWEVTHHVLLGDRIRIESLGFDRNSISIEMITHGPGDPMCCPTQQVVQTYELQDDQLILVDEQVIGSTAEGESAGEEGAGTDPVAEDSEAPPVELPAAAAEEPRGVVTAELGVNVRTGPGTDYPIIGIAEQGTEGLVVGKSEDGKWWVAAAPSAPNEHGWVAADYV